MRQFLRFPGWEGWVISERARNLVLQELARADRAVFGRLVSDLEPHPLQRGAILGAPRLTSDIIYFIDSGVVSLLASTRAGHTVEVAAMGREGVAGITDALGQWPLPYGLIVQLP